MNSMSLRAAVHYRPHSYLQQSGGSLSSPWTKREGSELHSERRRMMTRILVADDSDVVRHGMRLLLRQHEGWEVCGEAVDGQEAVVKAHQLAPDVVVLDFAMPVMNGIEAARQIRKERPNTAIVLCSMYLDNHLATVAHDAASRLLNRKSNWLISREGWVIAGYRLPFASAKLVASQRKEPRQPLEFIHIN